MNVDDEMYVVILDPGHGGHDPGALGPSHTREADITLQIATMTARAIRDLGKRNIRVVMTRHGDYDRSVQERIDIVNQVPNAFLLISLHCNAATPSAHGIEAWVHRDCAPLSRHAAHTLLYRICSVTNLKNRGLKECPGDPPWDDRSIGVLKHTTPPATLIELAFISNAREEALLTSDVWQAYVSRAIAAGVLDLVRSVQEGTADVV